MSPRVANFERDGVAFVVVSKPLPPCLAALTAAEKDVALAVVQGRSVAGIASARGTSPRTVERQLAAVYSKLGVSSRLELAALF